jgi:uncharacterized ion transporter superfamily protein YfcC
MKRKETIIVAIVVLVAVFCFAISSGEFKLQMHHQ